jgi:ribosome-binding factor A
MSQRVPKVESVIQTVVASALPELLERDAAYVTVTRVDAAPDLRNATVWIGLLGNSKQQDEVWRRLQAVHGDIQEHLSAHMTTKFVPVIHFKRDTGGAYAEQIDRLLKGLD